MHINTIAYDLRTEVATILELPIEAVGIVVTSRSHGRHTVELHLSGNIFQRDFDDGHLVLELDQFRDRVLRPLIGKMDQSLQTQASN